jgi:hypothetical protein
LEERGELKMAFGFNNYPQYYQPQQQYVPQMINTNQPPQNDGITWVQGENSAKSYPVAAGRSVLLMDSENPVMYIKSTDQSGVPLPLRIFDYKERTNSTSNAQEHKTDYISRNEFDAFRNEIRAELRQARQPNNNAKKAKEE